MTSRRKSVDLVMWEMGYFGSVGGPLRRAPVNHDWIDKLGLAHHSGCIGVQNLCRPGASDQVGIREWVRYAGSGTDRLAYESPKLRHAFRVLRFS